MMRHGGLVERIARATTTAPEILTPPPNLLDEVARVLRDAVESTARSLEREAAPPSAKLEPPSEKDEPAALPQILQHPLSGPAAGASIPPPRVKGQMLAPAILAAGLVAVALLMSATIIDISRLPGLAWLGDKPRPRLTALAKPADSLGQSFAATPSDSAAPLVIPPLSAEERTLLENCETMIVKGDMQGARADLARAASTGSANARFALAETFDPNVLAAWGLRERVADVGTARTLYEQALAAGDTRAGPRIEALREDNL